MTIEEREQKFRKEVQAIGGTIYTQEMLRRFSEHWTEPDRAPGVRQKMKFEKEKTWHTGRRLATWARNNYDGIQCYLTESQKTIAEKRHSFAVSLEPYLAQYGRDLLNAFYAHYAMPENKPKPEKLRWEDFEFWSLETKLKQWAERNEKPRF